MTVELKKAAVGIVLQGAQRVQEVIPHLLDLLGSLAGKDDPDFVRIRDNVDKALCYGVDANRHTDDAPYWESTDADDDLETLCDRLNEHAPDYCYFGTHGSDDLGPAPGSSGSDYGFWVDDDAREMLEEEGALVVDDTSKIPLDYVGQALHVNDHGNMTLWNVTQTETGQELTEVWAVV